MEIHQSHVPNTFLYLQFLYAIHPPDIERCQLLQNMELIESKMHKPILQCYAVGHTRNFVVTKEVEKGCDRKQYNS